MNANPSVSAPAALPKKGKKAPMSLVRRLAADTLGTRSGDVSNRLILILSQLVILTITVGGIMVMSGFYEAALVIAGEDALLWLDVGYSVGFSLFAVGVILPMIIALWRMACRMSSAVVAPTDFPEEIGGISPVSVADLFYPFTSPRAYGRTVAVAVDALAWLILPVVILLLAEPVYLAISTSEMLSSWISEDILYRIAEAVFVTWRLTGIGLGLLLFLLSGRRAGFGYCVFLHESWSLRDVRRYFRGFRRPLGRVFVLRMSLTGWVLLSVLGCLIPFLIHTIPYGLCLSACYAATMQRKRK